MITEKLVMRTITFLQLNFSLTDISDYIPIHFNWKYSGYCISEQSLIFSAAHHALSNWFVVFKFRNLSPLSLCITK